MYEFHYVYVKTEYRSKSRLLFTDIDSFLKLHFFESSLKLKLKMFMKILGKTKKMFDFSNYAAESRFYDDSSKIVAGKMKHERVGVPIKEFVALKPNMYSFLVDDSSEHEKTKGVNKNLVVTISHNEHKFVLLNQKCFRHSMNRIQIKNHRIRTYEINKISLSCFDDKIWIKNNGCDELALGYQS